MLNATTSPQPDRKSVPTGRTVGALAVLVTAAVCAVMSLRCPADPLGTIDTAPKSMSKDGAISLIAGSTQPGKELAHAERSPWRRKWLRMN